MHIFKQALLVIAAAVMLASCSTSKKQPSRSGRVIIVEDSKQVRVLKKGNSHHKGKHKGWYKNSSNPHHPRTTNPGHTKHKGKNAAKGKGKGKKH